MKNEVIASAFAEEGIYCLAAARAKDLRVIKEYLLPADLPTVIVWLLPYYVGNIPGNISLYARSADYHALSAAISERVIKKLQASYPDARFKNYADHSPIAEVSAAASLGLGVLGKNGLLINKRYGSFVFVNSVFCDLDADPDPVAPTKPCVGCGKCVRACPGGCLESGDYGACLSFVTQKKGELSDAEKEMIIKNGSVWGCDICQLACPCNASAEKTPVKAFYEDRVESVTAGLIENMSDEEFGRRAFSFRGKAPILRNLALFG